jgi:hypothetical protein
MASAYREHLRERDEAPDRPSLEYFFQRDSKDRIASSSDHDQERSAFFASEIPNGGQAAVVVSLALRGRSVATARSACQEKNGAPTASLTSRCCSGSRMGRATLTLTKEGARKLQSCDVFSRGRPGNPDKCYVAPMERNNAAPYGWAYP